MGVPKFEKFRLELRPLLAEQRVGKAARHDAQEKQPRDDEKYSGVHISILLRYIPQYSATLTHCHADTYKREDYHCACLGGAKLRIFRLRKVSFGREEKRERTNT